MVSRVVVAILHFALATGPLVGRHVAELAYGIADVEGIGLSRRHHEFLLTVFVDVRELTEDEHAFASAVAKVLVELQAAVGGIFAEFLHSHAQLVAEEVAIVVVAWRASPLNIVSTFLGLKVVGIITEPCGNRPPVHIARIVPVSVLASRETKYNFVASFVVPVEWCIPTVGHFVRAIGAVENGLGIFCAVGSTVFTHIHLSIEIQAHQHGSSSGL